jgi:hypothetical protein
MQIINHLGTSDVENYGDLLYPLVFRHILEQRNSELKLRHYSLLGGEAPLQASFETSSVQSLFQANKETGQSRKRQSKSNTVIGGGDLLRLDRDVIARHYGRSSRTSYRVLQRSLGSGNALSYLMRKRVPSLDVDKFYAKRFTEHRMDYPAVGPFLFDPNDLPRGGNVCYFSCGVPHDLLSAESERIKRSLDRASFIYLRDHQSAEKLQRLGVDREIVIAPDVTIILSDQFDAAAAATRGLEILSTLKVEPSRPVLCFQSQPYPGFDLDEILLQLKHYTARNEVVLLPTGYCHGDHEFLQSLAKQSRGVLKYAPVASIFDMMAIIAASDAFIGTSLHGNITASSYGIPHLFGPLPVAKAKGFLSVMNLPDALKLKAWSELNDKLEMVMELGPAFFSERARAAKANVYAVVDKLLDALSE